jgi:NADP-dependent 3-hydroxy acid dehydrogenase YdfG
MEVALKVTTIATGVVASDLRELDVQGLSPVDVANAVLHVLSQPSYVDTNTVMLRAS